VIANERQYRIAKAELRRFGEALEPQEDYAPSEGLDPRMGDVMADALAGQAETLREEIQRYEDLRDGRVSQREIEGFLGLLQALVEARIAAGLTQKALAERLGLQEQQVQRWEANLYSGVGAERLQEIADALGMEVKETVSYTVSELPA
jgi:DNA-binding XRE family transcriptional regulator